MNLLLKVKPVKTAEDAKIFCNAFSEKLEYTYFGDTNEESDDSKT